MAKLKKLTRSDEHKTFSEIELLFDERKKALEYLFEKHSFGCSEKEIKEQKKHLDYQLQEAEYDASLALLGAIEAAFRLDFDDRYTKKLKDKRSIEARRLADEAITRGVVIGYKIPIADLCGLLEFGTSIQKHEITLLKRCFKYRHWLAHGRYWQLHLGINRPTFSDIFHVAQTIQSVLQS